MKLPAIIQLYLPQDISGGENIVDYGGNHEQGSGGEQAEYARKHSGNFDNSPFKGEYNSFYGGGYRGRGGYGAGGYGGYGGGGYGGYGVGVGSYGYGYGGGGYGGRGGGYGGGGGGGGYSGGYAGDYAHGYSAGHAGNYGGSHGGGAEGGGYMGGYAREGFQGVQEDGKGNYGGSYLGNEDSGGAFGGEILKKQKRYIPKPPNPEILKRHGQSQRDTVEENWEEEERAEFEHDPEADNDEDDNDENDEADYEEDEATTNSHEYKRYAATILQKEALGYSRSISHPVSHPVSRSVSCNVSRAASYLPTRPPTRPVSPALPVLVPSTTVLVRKSKANSEKSSKDPTKLSFYTPQAKKVITGSQMFMHQAMVLKEPFLAIENHETLLFDCLTCSIKERGEKGLHVEEGYIEEHKEDIITFQFPSQLGAFGSTSTLALAALSAGDAGKCWEMLCKAGQHHPGFADVVREKQPTIATTQCWSHQMGLSTGDYLKLKLPFMLAASQAIEVIKWWNNHNKAHDLLKAQQLTISMKQIEHLEHAIRGCVGAHFKQLLLAGGNRADQNKRLKK
ncbi:MAG: hypothetical protein NXY57DRAFT_965882 [Lentinula lateritia]|nr:MAG: hypothetical protein NXY57DRAFT_965882 [Lentinula lateritia]